MHDPKRFIWLMVPLTMAGACNRASLPPPTVPPPPPCPIVSSSAWQASIIEDPHNAGAGRLTVTGEVTLPEDNWQILWGGVEQRTSGTIVEISSMPVGRPTGPGKPQFVQRSWRVRSPAASVTVSCRGAPLARLSPAIRSR